MMIGPLSEISQRDSQLLECEMHLSSSSLSCLDFSTNSGLSFCFPPNSPSLSLTSTVSACSLSNLTSHSPSHFSKASCTVSERLIGNTIEQVENCLFGTVSSPLGTHLSFVCSNTSISESVNNEPEVTEPPTITEKDQTWEFLTSTSQKNYASKSEQYLFHNMSFTATGTTTSFRMLSFTNFSGSLSLVKCTFTVSVSTGDLRLIYARALLETLPHLTIDQCSTKYQRTENTPTANHQIHTLDSFYHTLSSSNFSSQASSSCSRLFYVQDSAPLFQAANCIFEKQATSERGSVLSYSSGFVVLHLFDCLFSSNYATTQGGALMTFQGIHDIHRCVFKDNKAGTRGGAIYFGWPINLVFMEDCHFSNNVALEYNSKNESYAHYRGNDVSLGTSAHNSMITESIVGCSSDSELPRIGYYETSTVNGIHPSQELLLPSPTSVEISPPAGSTFFVDISAPSSNTDCTKGSPCQTLSQALAKTGSGFKLIDIGMGNHTDSSTSLSGSVGIVGAGWLTNSSAYTNLTSAGFIVSAPSSNVSLTAFSLFPSTPTTILLTVSSSSTVRLSKLTMECLKKHESTLLSLSSGTTTLLNTIFNTITLTSHAVIEISGSASVSFETCWFMVITRKSGNGGSCIDSSTSGTITMTRCDFGECSSSGRGGCADFVGNNGKGKVSIVRAYFTACTANSTLTFFGNDIAATPSTLTSFTVDSSCRSLSSQPHVLKGSDKAQMFFPSLYYSNFGINHPLSARFTYGYPLTKFPNLKTLIEDIIVSRAATQITTLGSTQTLEPTEATGISLTLCGFTVASTQQTSQALLTVGDNASFTFWKTPFKFDYPIKVTPFVVSSSSGSLTIYNLPVKFTSPTLPVPFVSAQAGSVTFRVMSFSTPLQMDGCSFITSRSGTVSFWSSLFSNIASSGNGAVLSALGSTITSSLSSFVNCSAKNGGAFFVELSERRYVSVAHESTSSYGETFTNCSALGEGSVGDERGKGGAIYLKGTSTHPTPLILSPSSNSAARLIGNRAENGTDVFVEESLFDGKTVVSIKPFGGNSFSNQYRVVIEGRSETDWEAIEHLIPPPTISVNGSVYQSHTDSMSGEDGDNCKWSSSYCATLGFGIGFVNQKYQNKTQIPQKIRFLWNMTYTENEVFVSDQDITVSGTTATSPSKAETLRTIVSVGSSSEKEFLFTISTNAKLKVTNIDFIPIASRGLFDGKEDGDSLVLSEIGMICSDTSSFQHPLIKTEKMTISIEKTTINTSSVSVTSLFGAPLLWIVTSTSPSFSSLKISSQRVENSSLIVLETDLFSSMNEISFSDCSRVDSGAVFFLVRSKTLHSSIDASDWSSHFSPTTPLLDLVCQDTNLDSTNPWFESSLLYYLDRPVESISVSGNEEHRSEHPNCGSTRLACSSLSSAFSSARSNSLSTLSLASSLSHTTSFAPSHPISIESSSTRHAVDLSLSGSFLVNIPLETVSFSSILLSLDSGLTSPTLFAVSSGTLTLASCSFEPKLETSTLSSTTTLVDVSGTSTLSLTDTTFENITLSPASLGCLIHLHSGASFSTNFGSLFSSISSSSEGSVIFVETQNLTETAKEASFVLLKESLPTDHVFNASERNWICGSENGGPSESMLYHFFPHTITETSLSVSNEGWDHRLCGLAILPCRSLATGFLSLKSTSSSIQLQTDTNLASGLSTVWEDQTMKSSDTNPKTITVTNNGAFVVDIGRLSISLINFAQIDSSLSNSEERTLPLISVSNAGSLTLSSCTITGLSFESGSLIGSTSSGKIALSGVSFVDCNEDSQTVGRLVQISRTRFENGDVVMKGVSITKTMKGEHHEIVLSGENVGSVVTLSSFSDTFGALEDQTKEKMKEMWGIDTDDEKSTGPLSYFFFGRTSGAVHVSSGFWDHWKCGLKEQPCSSLNFGYSEVSGTPVEIGEVLLDSDTILSLSLETKSKSVEISSDVVSKLSIDSSASLLVSAGELFLTSLAIVLPSSLEVSPFIVSGGTLSIDSTILITSSGTVDSPMIVCSPLFDVSSGSLSVCGSASSPLLFAHFQSETETCILRVDGSSSPSVEFSNCEFVSSKSLTGKSGVISLVGSPSPSTELQIRNCRFEKNCGTESNDIFVSDGWKEFLTRENFTNSFSDSDFDHVVIGSEPDNDLLPFSILKVNKDTHDDSQCHVWWIACSSVHRSVALCVQREKDDSFALRLIELETDVVETDGLSIGSKRIELFGSSQCRVLGCSHLGSLLTISTGTGLIHTLTLSHSNPSSQCPFLSLTDSGTLSLRSIAVEVSPTPLSSALISSLSGLLSLSMSNISMIELAGHSLIESSGSVEIDGCSFSSIISDSKGGQILTAQLNESVSVKITNTEFISSGSTDDCWVLLNGSNQATFTTSNWEGSFGIGSRPHEVVVLSQSRLDLGDFNPYSLLYELYPRTTAWIVVSSERGSADHPLCGSSEMGCSTIKKGVGLSGVKKVMISGTGVVGDAVMMNGDELGIWGEKKHGVVRFVGSGRIVNNEFVKPDYLTLSDVSVDVSESSLSSEAALDIVVGSMIVSDVSFSSSDSIGFTLIRMSGEVMKLTSVNMKISTQKSGCLLSLNGGTLDVNHLHLTSLSFDTTPIVVTNSPSIRLEKTNMTDCTCQTLLLASNLTELVLDSCTFSGSPSTTNEAGDVCEWNSGLIIVDNSNVTLRFTEFTRLSQGAMFVNASHVSIASCTFHDNIPSLSSSLSSRFGSLRHNVDCVGLSKISIGSLSGGDGSVSEWVWMETDEECVIESNNTHLTAPFFVPSLNAKLSSSKTENKTLLMSLVGSLLVPCDLKLRLFEVGESATKTNAERKNKTIDILSDQTNETHLSLSVPLSSVDLDATLEWRGLLVFGHGRRETEWIVVKVSAKAERKSHLVQAMKWMGPVIGGCFVGLLLLLLLFIFVCCRRRKKSEEGASLLAKQELDEGEEIIEKLELVGLDTGDYPAKPNENNLIHSKSGVTGMTKVGLEETDTASIPASEMVEGIDVDDIMVRSAVNKHDTLYHRLHKQPGQFTMDKLVLERRLARGLENIAQTDSGSEVLVKLSPHWVIFDHGEKILLQCESSKKRMGFFGSAQVGQEAMIGHEGQRWESPEVAEKRSTLDPKKAAVFSLGLLLWEIETEQVPLRELDAQNAQRQLGCGMSLSMEKVKDKNLAELITKCLEIDATKRPSLHDISHFLWKVGGDGKVSAPASLPPTNAIVVIPQPSQ
ncbi:hypothetical protein BLNAU_11121 [Blattamonas nauphoetae]|uniref:Protein kinase domain-containing protein n=1 Tax=Blattamonas nauphoetae TaxID=2049346 RepID=A0ABQ9XSN1_9EUKA|nr:hypothetical protein BLNAU_11121 [Blattamonas nauphoetae]